MQYQAHRVGGICSAMIAGTILYSGDETSTITYGLIGLMAVGGALGGVLPDIDLPTSHIGRRTRPVSTFINKVFGHRGFTHTLLALILLTYMLFLTIGMFSSPFKEFYVAFVLGLLIGYASHLLLDALTISGIPLLYPFTRRTFRLAKLRTGKHDIYVIVVSIFILSFFFFKYLGIS